MTTPTPNLDDTQWGAAVRWLDPDSNKFKVKRKTGLDRDEAVAFLRIEGRRRAEKLIEPVAYTLWCDDTIVKSGRYWPIGFDRSLAIAGTDHRLAERESDLDTRVRLLRNDEGLSNDTFRKPSVWYPSGIRRSDSAE